MYFKAGTRPATKFLNSPNQPRNQNWNIESIGIIGWKFGEYCYMV